MTRIACESVSNRLRHWAHGTAASPNLPLHVLPGDLISCSWVVSSAPSHPKRRGEVGVRAKQRQHLVPGPEAGGHMSPEVRVGLMAAPLCMWYRDPLKANPSDVRRETGQT